MSPDIDTETLFSVACRTNNRSPVGLLFRQTYVKIIMILTIYMYYIYYSMHNFKDIQT